MRLLPAEASEKPCRIHSKIALENHQLGSLLIEDCAWGPDIPTFPGGASPQGGHGKPSTGLGTPPTAAAGQRGPEGHGVGH